jgi:hypothetical protein
MPSISGGTMMGTVRTDITRKDTLERKRARPIAVIVPTTVETKPTDPVTIKLFSRAPQNCETIIP